MELYRENIIPSDGAGKGDAVLARASHQTALPRYREVAVDEIEAASVVDSRPQRVRFRLLHPVPAHVGDLEPAALRIDHRGIGESSHGSGKDGEPFDSAFVAALEQHLQS